MEQSSDYEHEFKACRVRDHRDGHEPGGPPANATLRRVGDLIERGDLAIPFVIWPRAVVAAVRFSIYLNDLRRNRKDR